MKNLLIVALVFLSFAPFANAQVLSFWEVNPGEGAINLPAGVKSRNGAERLPVVYEYATMPAINDPNWKQLTLDNMGKVNYGNSASSILDKAKYNTFTQIDITYFRAFLDLRNVTKDQIQSVTVTVGNVDDQARKLVYNSKNQDGTPLQGKDGMRGGKDFTTDFTGGLVAGEINTLVILQVDDNCCGNILNGGIAVKINGAEQRPTVTSATIIAGRPTYADEKTMELNADRFRVNAFSINQGKAKGEYFFGVNKGDNTGRIVKVNDPNITILQIKKEDLGSNTYAFKVENYPPTPGKSAYLVASADLKVKVEYLDNANSNKGAQFISYPAFTKAPDAAQFISFESKLLSGHYLRHSGLVLYINPEHPGELYKQDASWMIQKM
jgi:hypothetical protein